MKCFYHNDMDGICAGAIVRKAKKNQEDDGSGFEYIQINYNNDFPFDKIKNNEEVIIVDFSLQKDGEFERLIEITKNIIWIDHHKTAIEKHQHLQDKIKGIRQDGIAGCVLTWKYYFPEEQIPTIVEMIGDYDIWDFSRFGNDLNVLQAGMRLIDHNVKSERWSELFCGMDYYVPILEKGVIALQYRDNYYSGLIKSWSFETTFEGYSAICCNAGSVSSQLFDSVEKDYDLMIPFIFDGKKWTVSLYTKKDIDCSLIAKKYGGGGHIKASGFQCVTLPFLNLGDKL